MKNFILVISMLFFSFSCSVKEDSKSKSKIEDSHSILTQNEDNRSRLFCTNISVVTEIMDKTEEGKWRSSENWDQDNPLRSIKTRAIPDTFWIKSSLISLSKEFSDVESENFTITVEIKLIFGLLPYCLEPLNPIVSRSFSILESRLVTNSDFDKQRTSTSTKPLDIVSKPFYLKGFLVDNASIYKGYYLNQIQVLTRLISETDTTDCVLTYIHPVCANKPRLD